MDTASPVIRLARADDDAFILDLCGRFVECELPAWRKRHECANGIRDDVQRHLEEEPAGSHLFVAEDDDGHSVGFLHLQTVTDHFTQAQNCHIADLAVAPGQDGKGFGSALLAFAEAWAKEHRCRHMTLAVFPANARAIGLYQHHGYGTDLLRMAKLVK